MRFEVENKPPIEGPSARRVRAGILCLRNRGRSSFATLTDDRGNYLLAAGGGLTCMLERRDVDAGRMLRACVDRPGVIVPDGTILAFGAGQIRLMADEWLTAPQVAEAFDAFLQGKPWPAILRWRDQGDVLPRT
ncbi:MAG: hypothetical protein ACJ8G1_23000 [Vitreoscilla sp.]